MNGLPDEPISPNDSKGDSHISSQYVGTFFKPYHTEVHWRDTMNYAAAIDGMVMPGSEIQLQVFDINSDSSGGDLYFDGLNQQSKKAISKGYALIER